MRECKVRYCFTALLFFVYLNISISAQDSTAYQINYTLSEVTVSANKLDTKLEDVSTKVEVINRKKISASNGTRVPDILKYNSGAFLKSYGATPALQTISINGLGAEHTLILIDGVKLNSFQNSHIDLSLIPKDDIERIEIINNGVSSIYGSDAIGGVVNIVSKNRRASEDKNFSADASIMQGSFNTSRYSLGVYGQTDQFSSRVYFSSEKSEGNFKYSYNNGIEEQLKERANAAYSINDFGLNTQYIIDKNNLIRIKSSFTDQDKNVPGIETGTPPPKTKQRDMNWNNILISENKLSESISLKSNLNFQNNYTKYTVQPFTNSYYKNLVYSGASEIRYVQKNFGITSGYNFIHANLNSNEVEKGTQRNQHAVFVSSVYSVLDGLKVYPSGRYDYISDIDESALTYKLGINFQPISNFDFRFKGNAGRNFRSPSFNDLYWKNAGNKDLNPEKSFNAEAGFIFSFKSFVNGFIDFTYTFIEAKDKIVWTPRANGYWIPQNIAESVSKVYSIKLSIEEILAKELSVGVDGGLQFVDAKKTSESYPNDPSKDKNVPYIPGQSANISILINYDQIDLNLFYNHLGRRFSDFSNTKSLTPVNTLDGNVGVGIRIFEVNTKLNLEINNILNTNYEIITGYPMPLRNYRLTFSINY